MAPKTNGDSASPIHTILVLGDNRLSLSLIQALSSHSPPYKIHQAGPSSTSTSPLQNPTYHQTDFSCSSLTQILSSTAPDLTINTTTGGTLSTQKLFIDTAISTACKRFIPNEFSHDSLNPSVSDRLIPLRDRAEIISYLESRKEEMEYVGLATGYALDYGLQTGELGFDLKWRSATFHGGGGERFAAGSEAWRGRVLVRVLERWEEVKGRYLYCCGVVTCVEEVLGVLERKRVGGEGWEVGRNGDVTECVREAERRMERGFPDAGMVLMERSVLFDESLGAVKPFVEEDAKGELGLEGERVEEVVEHAIHQHEHHGQGGCDCG